MLVIFLNRSSITFTKINRSI